MASKRKTRFSITDLLVVTFAVAFALATCATYGAATLFVPGVIFILGPWFALRSQGSLRVFFIAFAFASLVFTIGCVRFIDNYFHYLIWDYFDPVGRFVGLEYDFIEIGSVLAPAILHGLLVCMVGQIFGCLGRAIYRRYCDRPTGMPDATA